MLEPGRIRVDHRFLAELELLVLAAVHRLENSAYGIAIAQEIEQRAGRAVSVGAVYATLERLGEKGFVRFEYSDPLPVRGGRSRKYARITSDGVIALRTSARAVSEMLSGLKLNIQER